MPLSKDAIKNLLDVMQKLSLAIAIVSLALLSSFLLSRRNIVIRAQGELYQLKEILKQIGNDDPLSLAREALPQHSDAWAWMGSQRYLAKLKTPSGTDAGGVLLLFPGIFVNIAETEWKTKRFKEVKNLEDVRKAWDAVASSEWCVLKEVPRNVYLGLPSLKKYVPLEIVMAPPPNIARPPLYYLVLPRLLFPPKIVDSAGPSAGPSASPRDTVIDFSSAGRSQELSGVVGGGDDRSLFENSFAIEVDYDLSAFSEATYQTKG